MGIAQVFHVGLLGAFLVLGVDGQTGGTVAGAGFAATAPIAISPGGIVTIYVAGLGARITSARAAESLPLPTNLAGISVSMRQTREPQGPFPVPLLAVFPVPACPSGVFDR